jgi:transposase
MNAAYFQLTKHVLPNAKVVIDRFHIVKHMNQAFNALRIREMNELRKAGHKIQAEKLKKNWHFLLKIVQTLTIMNTKHGKVSERQNTRFSPKR